MERQTAGKIQNCLKSAHQFIFSSSQHQIFLRKKQDFQQALQSTIILQIGFSP